MHIFCRPLLPSFAAILRQELVLETTKLVLETTNQQFDYKATNADCLRCCYVVRQRQIGGKAFPNNRKCLE